MSLARRVASAGLLIPLVGAAVVWAPAWLFALVVALVVAISLDEWFAMRGHARAAALPAQLVAFLIQAHFAGALALPLGGLLTLALLVVGAAVVLRRGDLPARMSLASDMVMGLFCIALPLAHFILVRGGDGATSGPARVAFLLLAVWGSDTAAYAVGVTLGRHRLAPFLSPKKSWEGLIGAVAGGALAGVLVGPLANVASPGSSALVGSILGLAGQLGDLFESLWKRASGVKDSGSIIPGHGGLLDRVDSFLFAAPVFHYLALVILPAP